MSLNVCTTFWSRSLFSLHTESKRLETTVARSMSAPVSWMQVLPTTKSRFAITFLRQVPDSSSFDKVVIRLGPLNRDRRGVMLRETHVSVRKIDRSVLAVNVDAELILNQFVLMACVRRGVRQLAREFPPQAK